MTTERGRDGNRELYARWNYCTLRWEHCLRPGLAFLDMDEALQDLGRASKAMMRNASSHEWCFNLQRLALASITSAKYSTQQDTDAKLRYLRVLDYSVCNFGMYP